jgi:phosphatidylglycerophosphate synthase
MFGETLGESTLMECSQYFNIDASGFNSCVSVISLFTSFCMAALVIAGVFLLAAITDWFDGYLAEL